MLLDFLDKSLLQQLVAVFVGAFLALIFDRWLADRQVRNRRQAFSAALGDALGKNAALVSQLQKDFARLDNYIPLYPLDLEVLDATASEKYSLGIEIDVCRDIDHVRYELRHLDEKLRLLREAGSLLDRPAPERTFFVGVRGSCTEHIPIVLQAIEQATRLLDRRGM